MTVRSGDEIGVQLDENPTTGYRWTAVGELTGALRLTRTEFLPVHAAGVGAGGRREFVFHASEPGRMTLDLVLCRPWEGISSPLARFAVIVEVLPAEEQEG